MVVVGEFGGDFCVIIGSMKCGTTSLFEYLKDRKEFIAGVKKETNFFLNGSNNNADFDQYFPRKTPGRKYYLDASPRYMKAPEVDPGVSASNMLRSTFNIKTIYLVRDPIERIRSHIRHQIAHGIVSYRDRFRHLNLMLGISRYAWQLDAFRRAGPTLPILIETMENIKENSVGSIRRIERYLEIEEDQHAQVPKVNEAPRDLIDLDVLSYEQIGRLKEILSDDVRKLHAQYGVDVAPWEIL